jgi:integrase/recombinase XerD
MDRIRKFILFLEAENSISVNTINAYKSDLIRFYEYLNSNTEFPQHNHNLTSKSFSMFLEREKKLGLKPSTLHRRKVTLKKYAEFLNQQGLLDSSVILEIADWQQDLWEKIANRKAISLTEAEVIQLFEGIGDEKKPRNLRDKLIISLILETGVSIGALVNLNLSDVNLRSKQIRFTDPQEHWSPIETSSKYLKDYLTYSRPELTQSMNEEALFVSQMGGRITRQGVWQVIRSWGETTGIGVHLSPRVLRHTAVRRMLLAGKSVEQIQQMLGHGNKNSTQALIRKISKSLENRRKKRK